MARELQPRDNGTTSIVIAGTKPDQLVALVDWNTYEGHVDIVAMTINGIAVPPEIFDADTLDGWRDEIRDELAAELRDMQQQRDEAQAEMFA